MMNGYKSGRGREGHGGYSRTYIYRSTQKWFFEGATYGCVVYKVVHLGHTPQKKHTMIRNRGLTGGVS